MNSDELKGKADEAKGKAEGFAGRAKEALERAKGAVQGKFAHAKEDVADEKEKPEREDSGEADPTKRT